MFAHFNERGIDCHAYDMKSFGQSEPDDEKRGMIASYEDPIADLVAFAKTIKGAPNPIMRCEPMYTVYPTRLH